MEEVEVSLVPFTQEIEAMNINVISLTTGQIQARDIGERATSVLLKRKIRAVNIDIINHHQTEKNRHQSHERDYPC